MLKETLYKWRLNHKDSESFRLSRSEVRPGATAALSADPPAAGGVIGPVTVPSCVTAREGAFQGLMISLVQPRAQVPEGKESKAVRAMGRPFCQPTPTLV